MVYKYTLLLVHCIKSFEKATDYHYLGRGDKRYKEAIEVDT